MTRSDDAPRQMNQKEGARRRTIRVWLPTKSFGEITVAHVEPFRCLHAVRESNARTAVKLPDDEEQIGSWRIRRKRGGTIEADVGCRSQLEDPIALPGDRLVVTPSGRQLHHSASKSRARSTGVAGDDGRSDPDGDVRRRWRTGVSLLLNLSACRQRNICTG
jgi:hypothetical protein